MTQDSAVYTTDLAGLSHRGKVRDMYDLGDRLMIVASDRISAYDVVMDQPVPGKGIILTEMSRFWLETLAACEPHHLEYVVSDERVPAGYEPHAAQLRGRTMVCAKAEVLPVECIVRGYIVGGGWREYQDSGRVSGIKLDPGLRHAQKFPEPLFTPSTKADTGHDEPISFEQACELAGREWMTEARDRSLAIYREASAYAESRGVLLADTKFEFGIRDGKLLLIDEVLTPDSSRFWRADEWAAGTNPPSFDKQFLRDYLASLEWNKKPPPPTIPQNILSQTRERYLEAYRMLTGRSLTFKE